MRTIRKIRWKRLVPALAMVLLLAAPPALAQLTPPAMTTVTEENGSATFNWTCGYYPTKFQWRGQKNDGDWDDWQGSISGTARSHTVGNIQAGNTYKFQMRAVLFGVDKTLLREITTYSAASNTLTLTLPDE